MRSAHENKGSGIPRDQAGPLRYSPPEHRTASRTHPSATPTRTTPPATVHPRTTDPRGSNPRRRTSRQPIQAQVVPSCDLSHHSLCGWPFCCGHWITKSRRYSTTFGAVRSVRRRWARMLAAALTGRPFATDEAGGFVAVDGFGRLDGDPQTEVLGSWRYAGRGRDPAPGGGS
ncbi:replication initiator [Frankia sp. AgW1.1]